MKFYEGSYPEFNPDSREMSAVLLAVVHLLQGKRLEVQGKAGFIVYMGSTNCGRRDGFYYEHPGGRTYKETPEEIVRAILPHVGVAAIANAVPR